MLSKNRCSMRDLIDLVTESFSEPFSYVWDIKSPTYWYATFQVNNVDFFVSADMQMDFPHPDDHYNDGDWFDLAFGITSNSFAGVIGTNGKAFRIFATAIAAFGNFIREVKPEFFMFSASKQDKNRFKLYSRLSDRFSPELKSLGYVRIDAPEHRYTKTSRYFDTIAWRLVS